MSKKALQKSDEQYLRSYSSRRGVNPIGEEDGFDILENMYIDYEGGADAIESVPGFRRLFKFEEKINGIFSWRLGTGEEYIIVHAGEALYRFRKDERDALSQNPPEKIADARDAESNFFTLETKLIMLDGDGLLIISPNGECERITRGSPLAYRPTTYINGKFNEPRNLFTDEFTEEYTVTNVSSLIHGTHELTYEIIDEKERTCAVTGAQSVLRGKVYIPSVAVIDEKEYVVTKVAPWAFRYQDKMTELYTSTGLRTIDEGAFYACTMLEKVHLSISVGSIGTYAFANCVSLDTVYLGAINYVNRYAFYECTALSSFYYIATEEELAEVEGYEALTVANIFYNSVYPEIVLEIPVHTVDGTVSSVTAGSKALEFTHDKSLGALIIPLPSRSAIDGKKIVVKGRFGEGDLGGFLSTELAKRLGGRAAIFSARLAEVFDGRIFLGGGSELGGAVFYSAKTEAGVANPYYFPIGNFFIDGGGDYSTAAMICSEDSLYVFKSEDDGSGSVFRHAKKENGYPAVFVRRDLVCYPSATGFLGETLFLSSMGVTAISRASQDSFDLSSRSLAIRGRLTPDKKRSFLTRLGSYVAVASGTEIFLGDSRSVYRADGEMQYAWYPLTGVATYTGETRVYRYADRAPEGYTVSEQVGEVANGVVMSVGDGLGGLIYYVEKSRKKIAVYQTEELSGGESSSISAVLGGELFFFGTEDGSLCLFNTDKRGVPPPEISEAKDYDPKEYLYAMGNRIHPYFYTYAGHSPRYTLATRADDCSLPYLLKSTVRSSLLVRFKSLGGGAVNIEVGTDKESSRVLLSTPTGGLDFSAFDLSLASLAPSGIATITVPDTTRGWIEKRVSVYSSAHRSPIGIHSINYRYKVKGRIK